MASQKWGLVIPETFRPTQYNNFTLFHPTFLYESCLDILGFILLLWISFKFAPKYKGLTFFAYLVLYSIIRFFIEQIRIDSALNIGGLPVAQIVSIILFFVGIIGIAKILNKNY